MPSFHDILTREKARKRTEASSARFKEILEILRKHEVRKGISPQETVALLEDLGPTFVKMGQIVSTHPDMIPAEYCEALGSLRTNVPPRCTAPSFRTPRPRWL